ncbi:MAG: hypothetical protein ACHQTE_01795 [Candidatus Saccharimonadales bacterium]
MEVPDPRLNRQSVLPMSVPQAENTSLIKLSVIKMGKLATRAYDDVRDFMKKEISAPRIIAIKLPEDVNDAIAKLKGIVQRSRETLAGANTVILPQNLFPDTVTIDRTRITIIKRTFFWSSSVISIGIDDVLNVSTSCGPLFGSLTISSRVMNSTDHFQIDYFWRKDVINLKHIIQGYIMARQNNIATDQLTREQLIETLIELGREE